MQTLIDLGQALLDAAVVVVWWRGRREVRRRSRGFVQEIRKGRGV